MRVASLLLLAALAACSASGGASIGASPADELDGTWVLRAGMFLGQAVPIVADRPITLAIDGTKVSGSACNIYGGTVAIDGDRIHFTAMSMTEMACQEPLMSAESTYHSALARVEAFARTGDTLILSGAQVELRFERQPKVADAPLAGTSWVLSTITNGETASTPVGSHATLLFSADGSMTGSTGCRGFVGHYTLDRDRVTVGGLAVDQRLCARELVGQDELALRMLHGTFTVAIGGRTLTITGPGGIGLVYSG